MPDTLRFVPCGDRSLLVYCGDRIAEDVNRRVHRLARMLREVRHPAVMEVTPGYHCLLVEYDPIRVRQDQVEALIRECAEGEAPEPEPRIVEIPVCYGGEYGPDLPDVAAHAGLSPEEVVARHAAPLYPVYCVGFSPGFPYLGEVDPSLSTPRLAEPRIKIPAGSVGIGGSQTGIYPSSSPGGWRIIGRTPLQLFDPRRNPPALLAPGDRVRFRPISAEEYAALEAARQPVEPSRPAFVEGRAGLRILSPGLLTTVQDLGRRGYQALGVPVAGAADFWSLMVGNWLLGNRARSAALEITLTGPEVEFTGAVAFCLAGAPIEAELVPASGASPVAVPAWTTLLAGPGDRLRLGSTRAGCRTYLCVAGGIDLPPVLGSLSEDLFGGIGPLGRPVQAGDWLPVGLPLHPPADLAGRTLPADAIPAYGEAVTIRVTRGPQWDAFTPEGQAAFLEGPYTVRPQSNRQGLRLEGPAVTHAGRADIISEPIPPGSVQVPASGQPILLLGNRQTVGGYTKIATAVYPDLARAAQLRPGDRLRFQEVDLAEAHSIAWAERRKLGQIRRFLQRDILQRQTQPPVLRIPEVQPEVRTQEQHGQEMAVPVTSRRTLRIRIGAVEYLVTVEEIRS
ncbi:MAG TPA: 5-oxoprolinase subunit PxpB [Symbiobacteriaceae bacterium]